MTTHTGGEFTLTDHDEIRWLPPEELKHLQWAPADIPLVAQLLDKKITEQILFYYENNATEYIQKTLELDIVEIRNSFISQLPPKAHILDLGCGSGRDSRVFLDHGFKVTAIDASKSIAKITSKFLQQQVHTRKAQEITESNCFDAIWACASLLHIPKATIPSVIAKLSNALTEDGILYMSFKQGDQERWDEHGRFFNDYSPEEITELLNHNKEITLLEIWTNNAMLHGKQQPWLNILLRKEK